MDNKFYYLNSSSTDYNDTKQFNLSDVFYKSNEEARVKINDLSEKIKRLVNAPEDAKVIFNSGATESIATVVHWAAVSFPGFKLCGTNADHSAVLENCKIYNQKYIKKDDIENVANDLDRTGAIYLTHVDGKNGEILNVKKVVENINNVEFLQYGCSPTVYEEDNYNLFNVNSHSLTQYRPLIFLDATQSILKVPIDMKGWGLDAVFWSNHKIGGHMGRGCLVIVPRSEHPFVPLIGGAQNGNLRGGSISANSILEDSDIYNYKDHLHDRRRQWFAAKKYLEEKGLKVYTPNKPHLFNTLLIDTGANCPYSVVSSLAEENIYMSPKSACMAERKINETQAGGAHQYGIWDGYDVENIKDEQYDGKPFSNAVRMSFLYGDELDKNALDKIAEVINN